MARYDHVLLTRFNLPSHGVEALIRADDAWLTSRWDLFQRYTVPSVRAQTTSAFRWLIYFDPESPDWLMRALAPHADRGDFVPVFRAEVSRENLLADLSRISGRRHSHLMTSNLDNDDGLAVDFVERLGAVAPPDRSTAVFLPTGLIADPSGVYLRKDPDNAFCSVAEPWTMAVTCWSTWHVLLAKTMPTVRLRGEPGWLQVVHGGNVSNRVRGRLVDPTPYRQLFPGSLDDRTGPTARALAKDRLLGAPTRAARDRIRGAVKGAALRVIGREGLDRLKLRLARR